MVKVSGNKKKTLIELTVDELMIEANYILERAILERDKIISQGVSKRIATATILKQIGTEAEFMASWTNKNKRIIDEIHSQLVAQPIRQLGIDNKSQKFQWILDSGANHCGDCDAMADLEPRTMEKWLDEGVGLPREGLTKCNVGCKCQLIPV